jgi:hypothetical protein
MPKRARCLPNVPPNRRQVKRAGDAAAAAAASLSPSAADAALAAARAALHAARAARPRPHLDNKVVTAWNGLAVGALARAARALPFHEGGAGAGGGEGVAPLFPSEGRPAREYLDAARRAAGFVKARLWDAGARRLRRSFCNGPGAVQGKRGAAGGPGAGGSPAWIGQALQAAPAPPSSLPTSCRPCLSLPLIRRRRRPGLPTAPSPRLLLRLRLPRIRPA